MPQVQLTIGEINVLKPLIAKHIEDLNEAGRHSFALRDRASEETFILGLIEQKLIGAAPGSSKTV